MTNTRLTTIALIYILGGLLAGGTFHVQLLLAVLASQVVVRLLLVVVCGYMQRQGRDKQAIRHVGSVISLFMTLPVMIPATQLGFANMCLVLGPGLLMWLGYKRVV
ncbi:MAG: hypothetical protein ACYCW6_25485 [Candidatus Xenobia bacterium]